MSLIGTISKIFGDKSSRDRKRLQPIVNRINQLRPEYQKLSNDELRANIDRVRAQVDAVVKPREEEIAQIRTDIDSLPFEERQPKWDRIDHLEKEVL